MAKKTTIDLPRELVIPTNLALCDVIPDEYKFLYAYISYRCGTRGYIWHENKTLSEHLNKNISSIKRGLAALSEAKWIYIDNWVKKGSLYHATMRRVIWIYSDYLVALNKGGYGSARPLPFRQWKERFLNAYMDQSKINLVLYFFPTMEKMGSFNMSYNPDTHKLYKYTKTKDKWIVKDLSAAQAEKAYQDLYEFYCDQHNKPKKHLQEQQRREIFNDFKEFQNYIRQNYIDKSIINHKEHTYKINALGLLQKIDQDGLYVEISTDEAMEVWQHIFANQDQIERE